MKLGCWGPVVAGIRRQAELDSPASAATPTSAASASKAQCRAVGREIPLPFMDEPRSTAVVDGNWPLRAVSSVHYPGYTQNTANKEPKWRSKGTELTTGYHPATRA